MPSRKPFLNPKIRKCLFYCKKEIQQLNQNFNFIEEDYQESKELNKLHVKQVVEVINKLQKTVDGKFGLLELSEKKEAKELKRKIRF